MVQISYLPSKARNSVYNIYFSYSDIMNPNKIMHNYQIFKEMFILANFKFSYDIGEEGMKAVTNALVSFRKKSD